MPRIRGKSTLCWYNNLFFFVLEIHIVTPKLPLWLKQGTNYWSAFMPRFCKVATSYPSPLRELTNHLPGCGNENFDLTNLWIEWRLTATWGDGSPLCLFCLDGVLFSLSPCLISPGQFPAVINLAPSTWKSKPFQKWNTIREGEKSLIFPLLVHATKKPTMNRANEQQQTLPVILNLGTVCVFA